jgi:hypothetical protein
MRKADYRKEGILNEKCIQFIYQTKKKLFIDLLKISEAEDFFYLFDQDKVIILLEIIYILNAKLIYVKLI